MTGDDRGNRPPDGQDNGLRARLQAAADSLATAIGAPDGAGQLALEPVKTGRTARTFRLAAGTATGFLKLFDLQDAAAGLAFRRERDVCLWNRGSGQVARLLAYSDSGRYLVLEAGAAGQPENPEFFARALGKWTASFEARAPKAPGTGDWYSYLGNCRGVSSDVVEAARGRLEAIPLCGRAISRGDPALHNYISGPDGAFWGCDFEDARLRPRGWDFVMAQQALIQRWPDCFTTVLAAFCDGYALENRALTDLRELETVARVLFCAQAAARAA